MIAEVAIIHVYYLHQSHPGAKSLWLLLRPVVCGWRFQCIALSGVKKGWAGRQEPWDFVQAPLSLSVIGRVPLVLYPWFGKPPAFCPSLGDAQVG